MAVAKSRLGGEVAESLQDCLAISLPRVSSGLLTELYPLLGTSVFIPTPLVTENVGRSSYAGGRVKI